MLLTALSRFWEWLRHWNIPGLGEAVGRLLAQVRWSRWLSRTRMVTRRRPRGGHMLGGRCVDPGGRWTRTADAAGEGGGGRPTRGVTFL